MSIPGSVDNGDTDTEYTVNPDRRILVEVDDKGVAHVVSTPNDKRLDEQDKRISALELQVHRLLNEQPQVPEADYAHIPAAEWEDICAELEALRAFKASVPWEEIDECKVIAFFHADYRDYALKVNTWLREKRPWGVEPTRPDMDERGVTLSHDAYDLLEREAAIGRSVPWADIRFCTTVTDRVAWIHSELDPNTEITAVRDWLNAHEPKEAAE